jgi:hypothetical protein
MRTLCFCSPTRDEADESKSLTSCGQQGLPGPKARPDTSSEAETSGQHLPLPCFFHGRGGPIFEAIRINLSAYLSAYACVQCAASGIACISPLAPGILLLRFGFLQPRVEAVSLHFINYGDIHVVCCPTKVVLESLELLQGSTRPSLLASRRREPRGDGPALPFRYQ